MLVQVGGVVHVVAAQDTMTANFADGMFILVLGMGDLAEAACGLVAAGAALAASLAAALAGLGDGAGFPFYYGGHVVFTFWYRGLCTKIVACAWFAVGDGLGRMAVSAGVVGSANWLEA